MHIIPPPIWRRVQLTNFTNWQKLADFLQLSEIQRQSIDPAPNFPLNVPLRLAEKMRKGDLDDPLLRQFLPTKAEQVQTPDFISDPIGDSFCTLTPKLLQKYQGRALLLCSSACAMHCRFCFRQNFGYERQGQVFETELASIAADTDLEEVILSGGDPLSLSNEILIQLIQRLSTISHIRRLRVHTRFPIGIPERLDTELIRCVKDLPLQMWWIIHSNHPRELDDDVLVALTKLRKAGAVVMNQAVLLKDVNDDVETQKALCEKLIDNGIVPYYLHQLDRVAGAAHFEVPVEQGKRIIEELRKQLPGYAVPRYVAEIYGEPSKTPL
jgi:EF-P beta-lysylation protein EpmB